MAQGRPALGPRKQVILRIPESKYAELLLLEPGLIDAQAFTRYGAINTFFNRLLEEHLTKRRQQLSGPHHAG